MKRETRGHEFPLSQAIYAGLLRAYPRSHRAVYGSAMALLFRDQCRDAWAEAHTVGLWKLWGRTLPDVACTSILERLAAMKERKTMTEKLANLFAFRVTPASTFFRVFAVVFFLVFLASVAVTFILPESYASTARIRVENNLADLPGVTSGAQGAMGFDPYFMQTTFEIMQSELVLSNVVARLNLNPNWGQKYARGAMLNTMETMAILRQRLLLAPVKNTALIAITVYSEDKNEAAAIANAVAESYKEFRVQARDDLAAGATAGLRQQYEAQELQIKASQALAQLQEEVGVPENSEYLKAPMMSQQETVRKMETEIAQLRSMNPNQLREVLPMVLRDSALDDLLAKLQDARQQQVTLTNDHAPVSIEASRVQSMIAELNHEIDDRATGIVAALQSQLDSAKAQLDELDHLAATSRSASEMHPFWNARQNLEQLIESHKLLFAKIEAQKFEAQMPKPALVQIIDTAEPGRAPVRPNKPLNLVLGAFAGIFVATAAGAAFAILSFILSQRMRKTAIAA